MHHPCSLIISLTCLVSASVAAADPLVTTGLISDKAAHPMTALSKPARLGTVVDAQFGTTICRISDSVAQFGCIVVKPAYSTIPAWNADESWLILYATQGRQTGHALFDGKTYQFIRFLDIVPADLEQFCWSSTDPDVLFYPYNGSGGAHRLVRYHISTGQKDVAIDFNPAGTSIASYSFGDDPFYCAWDCDLFGFRNLATGRAFAERISTQVPGTAWASPSLSAQVSPSGRTYVVDSRLYNTATNALIRNTVSTGDTHAPMAQLANGQDVWACVQFDNPTVGSGTVIMENLDTGSWK